MQNNSSLKKKLRCTSTAKAAKIHTLTHIIRSRVGAKPVPRTYPSADAPLRARSRAKVCDARERDIIPRGAYLAKRGRHTARVCTPIALSLPLALYAAVWKWEWREWHCMEIARSGRRASARRQPLWPTVGLSLLLLRLCLEQEREGGMMRWCNFLARRICLCTLLGGLSEDGFREFFNFSRSRLEASRDRIG